MIEAKRRRHGPGDSGASQHAAIVAAELRRIERRLTAFGPMPRRAFSASCGESHWRDGNVTEAVREGIRRHRLKELPLGWIAAER